MIWKKPTSIEQLNRLCQNSAVSHLGIEFTVQDDNRLEATVPVDNRTTQPFGLLHGGISATLAETLGSAAALLSCEENQVPVGTELNISHLKAIKQGLATGRATPLHLGRESQVWQVEIRNENNELCAVARLSVKLLNQSKN
ncbi:hotdog fold thioesterase [Glaesserella sp.]|uniref:hotdog fold thioesterase n=1 Tax=Glaesserella sp. TaxID=2094731 RepID=UPI00359FC7EE